MPIDVDGAKLRLQQGGDALKRCNCPRTREATTTTMEISEPFSTAFVKSRKTAFVKSRKTAVVKSHKTKKQKIRRTQPGPYSVSKSKNFPPIKSFQKPKFKEKKFLVSNGSCTKAFVNPNQ